MTQSYIFNSFVAKLALSGLAAMMFNVTLAHAACEDESQRHEAAQLAVADANAQLQQATVELARARLAAILRGSEAEVELAQQQVAEATSALDAAKAELAQAKSDLDGCETAPPPEPTPEPDCDAEETEKAQASAALEQAKANMNTAEAQLQRIQRLVERGVASERELENVQREHAEAAAQVEVAEQRLAEANAALDGCESQVVPTPVSGDTSFRIGLLPSNSAVSILLTVHGKDGTRYQLQFSGNGTEWTDLDSPVDGADDEIAWTLVASELEYRYLRITEEEQQERVSRGKVVIHDGGASQFYRVAEIGEPVVVDEEREAEAEVETEEGVVEAETEEGVAVGTIDEPVRRRR